MLSWCLCVYFGCYWLFQKRKSLESYRIILESQIVADWLRHWEFLLKCFFSSPIAWTLHGTIRKKETPLFLGQFLAAWYVNMSFPSKEGFFGQGKEVGVASALNATFCSVAPSLPFLPLLNAKHATFLRLQPYKNFRVKWTNYWYQRHIPTCLVAAEVFVGCTVDR